MPGAIYRRDPRLYFESGHILSAKLAFPPAIYVTRFEEITAKIDKRRRREDLEKILRNIYQDTSPSMTCSIEFPKDRVNRSLYRQKSLSFSSIFNFFGITEARFESNDYRNPAGVAIKRPSSLWTLSYPTKQAVYRFIAWSQPPGSAR